MFFECCDRELILASGIYLLNRGTLSHKIASRNFIILKNTECFDSFWPTRTLNCKIMFSALSCLYFCFLSEKSAPCSASIPASTQALQYSQNRNRHHMADCKEGSLDYFARTCAATLVTFLFKFFALCSCGTLCSWALNGALVVYLLKIVFLQPLRGSMWPPKASEWVDRT